MTFLETWQAQGLLLPGVSRWPKKSWIGISLCPFPSCTYSIPPEVEHRARKIPIRIFSLRRWTFDRQTCSQPSLKSQNAPSATEQHQQLVTMGNLVSFISGVIAPLFLIVAPITSYADQIWSMHTAKSSAGFSLDIPLIMLVASLLRYVGRHRRTWAHTNKIAQNILFSRGTIRTRAPRAELYHDWRANLTSQGCVGSQARPSFKRG